MNDEKKPADDWCDLLGIEVRDPDGWREDDTPWNTPITREDFMRRCMKSTVRNLPEGTADEEREGMNVEILLSAEEDEFEPLLGNATRLAQPALLDLKIVVDGVTALHLEKSQHCMITAEGFQKLELFLQSLKARDKIALHLDLYGSALVRRAPSGEVEVVDPQTYQISVVRDKTDFRMVGFLWRGCRENRCPLHKVVIEREGLRTVDDVRGYLTTGMVQDAILIVAFREDGSHEALKDRDMLYEVWKAEGER